MSACACMGPQGKDPLCPCQMRQQGLIPTITWTDEKIKEFAEVLEKYNPTGLRRMQKELEAASKLTQEQLNTPYRIEEK